MKSVTLAKANKIRNQLEDKIVPTLAGNVSAHQTITLVGYETELDIAAKFDAASKEVRNLIEVYQTATLTVAKLRKLIAFTNEKHQVNDLLSDIASAKNELLFWKKLAAPFGNFTKSSSEIAKAMAYEASQPVNNGYRVPSQKAFVVYDHVFNRDFLAEKISNLEVKIRTLEEDRNTKNYATQVSLDDDIVKVLEAFKII